MRNQLLKIGRKMAQSSYFQANFKKNFNNNKMIIHSADYVASFTQLKDCPPLTKPEYAFIGRSNVGKSSIINSLTERKSLARISNNPGKTQTINYYLINKSWHLVDLPGYGYAKVSKSSRRNWERFIRAYLSKRENLQCVFLLIDSRISPQKIDIEFANWMGEMHLPFVIVYTKADKSKPETLAKNIEKIEEAFLEYWEDLPQRFTTSALKDTGRLDILEFIDQINQNFIPLI